MNNIGSVVLEISEGKEDDVSGDDPDLILAKFDESKGVRRSSGDGEDEPGGGGQDTSLHAEYEINGTPIIPRQEDGRSEDDTTKQAHGNQSPALTLAVQWIPR